MFALKPRKENAIRVLLIAVILLNALIPSGASLAAALSSASVDQVALESSSNTTQGRKGLTIKSLSPLRAALQDEATPTALPTEPETSTPEPTSTLSPTLEGTATSIENTSTPAPSRTPAPTQTSNSSTGSSDLSVEFSVTPRQAKTGDQVTFKIEIVNHGRTSVTGLRFSNILPEGFNAIQSNSDGLRFDAQTRELTFAIHNDTALASGASLVLEYTMVLADLRIADAQIVDTAHISADGLAEPLAVEVMLNLASVGNSLTQLDSRGGTALGLNGQLELNFSERSLAAPAVLFIRDLTQAASSETDGEPGLVFELGLRLPQPQNAQPLSPLTEIPALQENDRAIPLEPIEAIFSEPVELSVSFDSLTDLATLGADQAPFLVTLDEASGTWVRVPLKSIDREANRITAELTHFSTWGVGFGPSFPTNGANVLLFDNAYPTLFTGRSKYSIPIWTPPGRNGMQPSLALSYSSGSVDGVLGDVQAPWVGMGWSIDTAEIARKITTTGAGYGYENKFMLLLNGTGYELLQNATTADRYHTKEESFLYIQRHNDILGSPSTENSTGEWWEVVEKDGTRWRLGYTTGSEQLAPMVGYPGTNPPTGAWATLGYAGNEPNLVAGRWRVDQVTDVYNNQMTFTYQEEYDVVAGTSAYYDHANYIYAIYYTSHTTNPAAAYSVVFIRESRGANDLPAVPTDWDNWDTERLDRIEVTYGGNVVRTYDLGYQTRSYTDGGASWQTTTLTSLATSGSTTLTPVVNTIAPTVTFTYVDKDNRAVYGSWNEWAYPRLATINNGWGGVSTYTYENDGRPYTSWYNWRVKELAVTDNVNASPMKSDFAYSTPCYNDATAGQCNAGSLGSLIGYSQTTATNLDFDGTTVLAKTVHKFLTAQEWQGREYETLDQDAAGTTLHKTYTLYNAVETSGYPTGAYFVYATTVDEFVHTGALVQVSHVVYSYNSNTGNLTSEWQFFGTSNSYRKTEYQYVANTNPAVWILNTVSRRTVQDANGVVLSEQQYGYNGNLPGYSSPNPHNTNKPDLSRAVNGTQTIDTKYVYDTTYGNLLETHQYETYGTTGSQPSGTPLIYSTSYDSLKTYVLSTDPPLLPATMFTYDYGLGLPITVTDPNGGTTTTAYDGLGRVTSVKYQGYAQANVKYTYPIPSGAPPTVPLTVSAPFAVKMQIWDETISDYRSAWQIMDGLGRVIQTQSPYETADTLGLTDTAYDARGLTQYQGLPRVLSGTGSTYLTPSWASVPHTTASYDALGRTTSAVYPDGSSENYSYSGLRTTAIDRNSHKKVQEYDAFGRLIKVEEYMGSSTPYALYATTNYEYDERDLLKKVTDAVGNQTTLHYNGFGRKDSMTDLDMGVWSYGYDVFGNLNSQIDARGCTTSVLYDDLNRPYQKTYSGPGACAATPQVDYTYDSTVGSNEGWGRRTGMTDGSGSTTWFYNALGQVTNQTNNIDSTNYTTSGTFDAFGRPLNQTLPSSEQLNYSYNAMGALASLSGTNSYVSQIHYAATGQVTYQTLGNGLLQQYCYDANTRRIKDIRVYPGAMQTCGTAPISPRLNLSFSYQPNGNISQIADATRNELIGYAYDELDRLLSGGGLDNRAYTYSATGNITSQNDTLPNPGTNGLAAWWSMDETSGTRNDSYSVNHLADTNTVGAVSGKRGNAADFEKNNLEYLSKTSSAQLQMSTSDIYVGAWIKAEDTMVSNPNVISKLGTNREFNLRVLPSGVVQFIVYDTTGNNYTIASSTTGITYGQWVYVEGWTDKAKRTVYVNVNNGIPGSATWLSNENRNAAGSSPLMIGAREYLGAIGEYWDGLIDEAVYYKRTLTPAERTWLYGYGIGRAYADLSLPSGSPNTYNYDDTAHKHAVTSLSTGETYTYDANGNMITRVENGLTYTQTFDAENRLISVTVSGQTTQFIYDGNGNMVKKINPDGSKTIYVGGIYEVDKTSGGTVTRTVTYYPAGGAMRIVDSANNKLYYILKDHLGSASVVTDASGVTVGEQRYYPYGATRWTTGTIYTDKLYTGQREITGLGIYHYGARFYSPYINRFLSPDTIIPDPSNPQDLNRFSYVRNNPLRYVDPTGHVCSDPDDPTPSCDGSGGTPPNLPAPLPDAPVVITNPGPLDDGQEQDDPTPTSSLDPHDDGNTLPIDPLTTTTPVTQTPSPSGPNWYTIAAGVAVVAISLVAISLIVAGVIITGGTAAGIAIIAGEMLLSTEIWLFISITAGSMYVGYQGIQLIGEGIEGK